MTKEKIISKFKPFEKITEVKFFKKEIKGEQGLALDIDDTIAFTFGCWVNALKEKFGDPEKLTPEEMVVKYKLSQFVPYWQTSEVSGFIENLRIDNSLQVNIPLIENSNRVVQKINKIIPIKVYITNRPGCVYDGTVKFLKKHHFPDLPIILDSTGTHQKEGAKWKANVLKTLYPEIMGIIDDSSSLIKELEPDYEGVIFHYNHQEKCSDKLNVIPCNRWG